MTLSVSLSSKVNTTFITLYQPLSLVLFYKLICTYYGGENSLRELLINQRIPFEGLIPMNSISRLIPTMFMTK